MKLGKDTVVSIQKYTETFRNTAKTCLIVNTVSKIQETEDTPTKKSRFESTDPLANFTKFAKTHSSQTTINSDENIPPKIPLKKSSVFFGGNFDAVKISRKDVDDLENCCYFDDNLFYDVQTSIFQEMSLSQGILKSKTFGIDFKKRKCFNYCGFDTEFVDGTDFDIDDNNMSDEKTEVVMQQEKTHELVSMQFSRKVGNFWINTIVFVEDNARFQLRKLIIRVDEFIRKMLYLKGFYFNTVYLAHFGIVDYSKFTGVLTDYHIDNGVLTNVRNCLITRIPIKIYDYDDSRHKKIYGQIHFRDTMLLDNPKSLRKMGAELGFKKYMIGDNINNMGKFLKENQDDFYNYAIRDSEIVVVLAENYYADELFKDTFPITLSSQGAKYAKNLLKKKFGLNDEEFDWNFKGKYKVKMYNKTEAFYNSNVEHYIKTMSYYYGGGRNETFLHGIFKGSFLDVDGTSFYPSSASMIPFLDLSSVPHTQFYGIVNDRMFDFSKIECGMCQINFEYPDTCNLVGIPVFTPKNGLIYPRSGKGVWCSVQEIKSAYRNGATIEVLTGFIFKEHKYLENPFEVVFDELLKERKEAIEKYGKGSSQEKFLKLVSNSIYGKTGQGIKGKKGYNFISDTSEEIVESSISSGVYANSITAIARATITELMLLFCRYSSDFEVCNVVTDGFLLKCDKFYSDEELNKIMYDNYNNGQYPNLHLFVKQLEKKSNGKRVKVLAVKHFGDSALLIKTRGAVVFNENSESSEGVQIALTGFKFSKKMAMESDYVKAIFLLDLYKTRTERVIIDVAKLMDPKMYRRGKQELSKTIYKKFSFNYDYKRRSVDEEEYYGTLRFKTEPWATVEEFYENKEKMESNKDIQIKSFEDVKKIDYVEDLKRKFQMKMQKKYTSQQVFEKFLFALAKTKKLCFNGEIVKSFDDLYKIYEFNNIEPSFSRDFYRKQKISDNFHFAIDKNLEFSRKLLEINLNGSFKILSKKELEKV